MAGASAARLTAVDTGGCRLFEQVGRFLADNHLSPDPLHYAFAYHILTDREGALAKSVVALTDGGVRLTSRDIASLGGEVAAASGAPAPTAAVAEGLVARTQMQVDGFNDMMQAMRTETQGFGRDLAASADAIRLSHDGHGVEGGVQEVMRLTAVMLDRVRTAEARLDAATHEAAELRAKLEEARSNARRDPLTDLPNRRAFEEAFAAQDGSGTAICIAMCDVDHFKLVNDRFGHAVGDRVLKAIGEALAKACTGHLVARYGGEEFAILFAGIDRAAATAILEEARETVAAKRYRLRESDEPLGAVTFSAGLTTAQPDERLATVVGRADRLLYVAKNAGRNQLEIG